MTVKNKNKPDASNSTQKHLPFSEIRNNIVIMKDWSTRMVLKCSTVNFLLKSNEEQESIIMSYQRFLNTLEFPIQIIVRSTKLDIDAYLAQLNWLAINHTNPKLQTQTYEYIEYLKKLIEIAQIMKKEFYIVIPFDNLWDTSVRDTSIAWLFKNFMASMWSNADKAQIRRNLKSYERSKKELNSRAWWVKTALESIWIRATELDKKELIKFIFDYYNPTLDWQKKYEWLNSDLL